MLASGFPALGTEDLDLVWMLSPSLFQGRLVPKGWAGGPSRVPALSPVQPIPAGPACSRRCSPQGSEEMLELSSPQPVLGGSQSSPLPFIGAASRPSPRSCPRLAEWPYLQESPWHGL